MGFLNILGCFVNSFMAIFSYIYAGDTLLGQIMIFVNIGFVFINITILITEESHNESILRY